MLYWRPAILSAVAFIGLGAYSAPSLASFDRMVTEMELSVLPHWCLSAFQNSAYSDRISPKKKSTVPSPTSRKSPERQSIPGGHHFCYGLVELSRAKKHKGSYAVAIDEFNYSYALMDASYPNLSYVASYLGKALYAAGKRRQATDVWTDAIAAQPTNRQSYLALTEALLGEGQYEKALEVMLAYDKMKVTETADAEQFLAQAYFKMKQYDQARIHAEKAHQLGYPFTGLLDTLNKQKSGK